MDRDKEVSQQADYFNSEGPEIFSQFKWAVVRIAVHAPYQLRNSDQAPLALIYASVSLLPPGRQRPLRPAKPFHKHLGQERGTLWVDRIVMEAEQALAWYRSPSQEFRTPLPHENPRKRSDGQSLSVGDLADFPSWPVLGVPMQSESLTDREEEGPSIPFGATDIARYHRRLSGDGKWVDSAAESLGRVLLQSDEGLRFLERHIYIDFGEYPEYLGGITLVVPDQTVQTVRQFVEPKADNSESLLVQVVPRPGQALQGLYVTILEGENGMLTSFMNHKVPEDGIVEVRRSSPIQSSGLVLSHQERGVLLQVPMRTFIRQMNLRVEVSEEVRHIEAPDTDAKRSTIGQYTSTRMTQASSQTLGARRNTQIALQRIIEAQTDRLLRSKARRYEQTWFNVAQRKEALDSIREKIKGARRDLLIVDPYFGANQISQLLFALQCDEVTVTILTSSEAFKIDKKTSESLLVGPPEQQVQNRLQLFRSALVRFESHHKNKINVHVAQGDTGLFHDRFLAVDGRVWILGSSLNMLGVRPTLMMRVPHSKQILQDLQVLLDKAIPLQEFESSKMSGTERSDEI